MITASRSPKARCCIAISFPRSCGLLGHPLALDHAGHVGRHATGTHGRDLHRHPGLLRFDHLAAPEVERFVLATARPPEQHVTAFGLGRSNFAACVVLIAGKTRKQNADTRERVAHQARAVETDSARAGVDSTARSVETAAAPGI